VDGYRALLIGNSTFPADPQNLQELRGPVKDVAVLGAALTDRDTGLFDHDHVGLLVERPAGKVLEEVEAFLLDARRDDQLLLYYSGHGLLDERNQLFLAAHNTRVDRLRSTAVSAASVSEMLGGSAARTAVILLDCCHSGAFKGNIGPGNLAGSGRFVLTSCRSGELANDADRRNGTSLFTQHLVDGLTGGVVDLDGDGRVDVDEVYRYVHDRLVESNRQIPQRRFDGSARTPALARRPLPVVDAPQPPADRPETGFGARPEAAGSFDDTGPEQEVRSSPSPPAAAEKTGATLAGAPATDGPPATTGPSAVTRWIRGRRRWHLALASAVLAGALVAAVLVVVVLPGGNKPKPFPPAPLGPAELKGPKGMFFRDADGDLYIADSANNRVVRVAAADHKVSTVAGNYRSTRLYPGVRAIDAPLDSPEAIAPMAGGGFYIVDHVPNAGEMRLLAVSPIGLLTVLTPEGPLAESLLKINDVVADQTTGLLYLATDTRVLKLNPTTHALTAVAGTDQRGFSGDGGPATEAELDGVVGLALDPPGKKLYIADSRNGRVRTVDENHNIATVAGRSDSSYAGEGHLATDASLSRPHAVAVGIDGAVYIVESDHVRKVADKVITTVAGPLKSDVARFEGDGRPATETTFSQLSGIAVDAQNRMYLSDGISRVRLVNEKGIVSTYA